MAIIDNFYFDSLNNLEADGLSVSIAETGSNFTRTFSATVGGGTSPYTYSWNFGDGNTSTQTNPTHVYSGSGTYNVTLTVTDVDGRTGTDTYSLILSTNAVLEVTDLELWIGGSNWTDQSNFIKTLSPVDTVSLNTNPALNIIAVVNDPLGQFQRLEFFLDGNLERTESGAPLTFAGDSAGNILNTMSLTQGTYEITAVPYRSDNTIGVPMTVNLTLMQQSAPVANPVNLSIPNNAGTITVSLPPGSVTDADNDINEYSLEVITPISNGTIVPSVSSPLSFDINTIAIDSFDTFTYRVSDLAGNRSNIAQVNLTIGNFNPSPVLPSFIDVTTVAPNFINIDVASYATDNTGIDPGSVVIITQPANGTIFGINNGVVTYFPTNGFLGIDTFTVSIDDDQGATSNIATVRVNVVTNAIVTLYDDYDSPVGGVWEYEVVRPNYRRDFTQTESLYQNGAITNITPAMSATQIETAINSAPAGAHIVWQASSYNLDQPIRINRGNFRMSVQNDGIATLNPTWSGGWMRHTINISGTGNTGSEYNITDGLLDEHSYVITVPGHTFTVNQWVMLKVYGLARSYTGGSGGNQVTLPDGVKYSEMNTIAKVVAVNGSDITLDRKVAVLPGWIKRPQDAKVQAYSPISNIVIKGGTFVSTFINQLGTASSGSNPNSQPNWLFGAGVGSFFMRGLENFHIENLQSRESPSVGFWVDDCVDGQFINCGAYGAHNRGSGGHGYAFLHGGCTNVRLVDWYDERCRHSVLPSVSSTSVAMNIHIRYTESNPEFSHGGFSRLQSIIVDELNPHQGGENYRIFDDRETKVTRRNAGWVKVAHSTLNPYAEYDFQLRTYPGYDCNIDLGSEVFGAFFRDYPNAQYETFVGDNGFVTSYRIAMAHGMRTVLNPGTHNITVGNSRGNIYFVPQVGSDSIVIATLNSFRTTGGRTRGSGDVIMIATQTGLDNFSDLNIFDSGSDCVITLPNNGGSITLKNTTSAQITEAHIKVVSLEYMKRVHHRIGVQYNYKNNNPYIVSVAYPSSTQVAVTWNRPVSLSGSGNGYWYDSNGSIVVSISGANTSVSSNTTTFTVPDQTLKARWDNNFFTDGSAGCDALSDWHEDVVTTGDYEGLSFAALLSKE